MFTSSSLIDFRRISKKCISWRMLAEVSTRQTVKSNTSRVTSRLLLNYKILRKPLCMESLCYGKDLKIGEYLVRSRSIKSGPSLVVKSYVGCSNQFS